MPGSIILALTVIAGAVRAHTLPASTVTVTTVTPDVPVSTSQSLTTTSSANNTCKDNASFCNLLDTSFYCTGEYLNFVFEKCRKTCNLCGITDIKSVTSPQPSTRAPVCHFGNKTYTQGQSLTVNCEYNCSCVSATLSCSLLCPIPTECRHLATHTCTTPHITLKYEEWCYYKGQKYTQGQTWQDGCNSCTCTDAMSGRYNCVAVRCLDWSNMPSICHLEDHFPQLCCPQPKCPSGFIINIPEGYKNQYPEAAMCDFC